MQTEKSTAIDPKLVDRVKGILSNPKFEWPIIAAEQATVNGLFKRYVMVLAAIPALSKFVHEILFDDGPIDGLLSGGLMYVLSILSVYVLGIVIDGLAQNFGSEKNTVQSMKLAVYAMTPAWIAGVLYLIGLDPLVFLISLYGVYLLYLGLGPVKLTPADKSVAYTAVIFLVAMVLNLVIWSLVGAVIAAFTIVGIGAATFALS